MSRKAVVFGLVLLGVLPSLAFAGCDYAGVSPTRAGSRTIYKGVEGELKRQSEDEAAITAAFQAAPSGVQAPNFLYRAQFELAVVEMMAKEPNLINGIRNALDLAEHGAEDAMKASGIRDSIAQKNIVGGMLASSRLLSAKPEEVAAAFKKTAEVYKPEATYIDDHGWGMFFLGVDTIDRARAQNNPALEQAGLAMLNDHRLVEERLKGGPSKEVDERWKAELQARFAQMSLHFGKDPQALVALRDQAKAAVGAGGNEDHFLGLVSLHLESGRSIPDLVKDLSEVKAALGIKKVDLSAEQSIWAIRLARTKNIALAEAVVQVSQVVDAEVGLTKTSKPVVGAYSTHTSSYDFHLHGKTGDGLMLALLTYTDSQPAYVIQQGNAALKAAVKAPNDYGAPSEAEGALARMVLERMRYSAQGRYLVSQAVAATGSN